MGKGRYNLYSEHLSKKFGAKVYKLPVNLPGTCPNRDGTLGWGGCVFCDEEGAGFECLSNALSVKQQIAENMAFFRRRYHADKFIVYFQAFTNTYMPLESFKANILQALEQDVVGLAISTRPDCINDSYLAFLGEIKEKSGVDINIELGLQTVNYHTLARFNRGHSLAEFIDAALRIKQHGLTVCAHLILNLPWDDLTDCVENAKIISALGVEYVKLHTLYVVRGTVLGDWFQQGEFTIISLEDYVARVGEFLSYLHPSVVIQRLVGRGPRERLLFSNWGASWWLVKQRIEEYLDDNDIYQGMKCDYLNGKALRSHGYA
jgi:radical SAM protein (TIGR01212 family)